MLLWLQPPPSRTAPPISGSGPIIFDDDEKAAKLIRRARAKYMNMLLATGLVLTVLSVMMVKVHHSPKLMMRGRHPNSRSTELQQQQPMGGASLRDVALLPPDSIYRREVENAQGKFTSLLEYAGKVTLVVNTACQ